MTGRFQVEIGELSMLASGLETSRDKLQQPVPRHVDAAQVGDKSVAAALETFLNNWDYRRRDLANRMADLAAMLRRAAEEYQATDDSLKNACQRDNSSATKPPDRDQSAWIAAGLAAAAAITSIDQLHRGALFDGEGWWAEANRAWYAMTAEQRASLLTPENARRIAGDDGYPPDVRFAANRFLVEQEIARLEFKEEDGYLSGSEQARLALYRDIVARDKKILLFDPSGDGRIAVVEGDLATATNVAVTVPGISNSLDNFSVLMAQGERLHVAAGTDSTAVVTWLGYDAPVGVLPLNPRAFADQVLHEDMAVDGARDLKALVTSVRGGAHPGAQITVIGHSYGSLVTGIAASGHLDADRVVFVGSPGVGVDHASELNLHADSSGVYAMAHDGFGNEDYVQWAAEIRGPFGVVPTSSEFGATHVDAGASPGFGGASHNYYEKDTDSLRALGRIVNGSLPADRR